MEKIKKKEKKRKEKQKQKQKEVSTHRVSRKALLRLQRLSNTKFKLLVLGDPVTAVGTMTPCSIKTCTL